MSSEEPTVSNGGNSSANPPPKAISSVDPDYLKAKGQSCQSVIFTDKLYLDPDKSNRSHASFFGRGMSKTAERVRDELAPLLGLKILGWSKDKFGKDAVAFSDDSGETFVGVALPGWFDLYDTYLFGRIGVLDGTRVASFWGSGSGIPERAKHDPMERVPFCVRQLASVGAVDADTVVVYGDGRSCLASDILVGKQPGKDQIDPEAARRNELARRMHLTTGSEKREIMKKLGVGGHRKENQWDNAMRSHGLQAPGGSIWRMSSEGKQRRLDGMLDGIA